MAALFANGGFAWEEPLRFRFSDLRVRSGSRRLGAVGLAASLVKVSVRPAAVIRDR